MKSGVAQARQITSEYESEIKMVQKGFLKMFGIV
jgi:hypothetical protein